jgi:phage terminase small subunit
MARPPKPIALHILDGTDRKDRMEKRQDELKLPPGSVGDPPEWFSPLALEEWNRLTGDPDYSQVLAPVFRGALIEYCFLYGKMLAQVQGTGPFVAGERQMLHSLRMQLGVTPASQSKVKGPKTEKPGNKWAKFGSAG